MEILVIDDDDDDVSVEFVLSVIDETLNFCTTKLCDVNGPPQLA